jgi:hypothetical protein
MSVFILNSPGKSVIGENALEKKCRRVSNTLCKVKSVRGKITNQRKA